jgi:hypothetical protein
MFLSPKRFAPTGLGIGVGGAINIWSRLDHFTESSVCAVSCDSWIKSHADSIAIH